MNKLSLAAAAALGLAACAESPTSSPATSPEGSSPSFAVGAGDRIPGRFIVVLREDADPRAVARDHGAAPDFIYTAALKGFAGPIGTAARNGLMRDARVAYLEQDQVVHASTTQAGATWGLDRADQRDLPLSTTFSYTNTGAGVTAYIIDTGILFAHGEFGGRARTGYDAVTAGGSAGDCHGHGTHVAGTVGGATYGVAKSVALVAVRVLDCGGSGSNSGVIAGVDWVTANRVRPAVANMSLGGGASTALDDAVRRSIAAGVTYGVAAGNGNWFGWAQNACNYSPARVGEAITVGATDKTDKKASWSNYGTCLDLFAPGVSITSSWYTSPTATNTISGTSMATPHVVGVAALYAQGNPTATPQQVRDALVAASTLNKVTSPGSGSPNRLLFTSY